MDRALANLREPAKKVQLRSRPQLQIDYLRDYSKGSSQTANMSGASDKARFYLEQSVPQLREFEEKNIFSKVCTRSHTVPVTPPQL